MAGLNVEYINPFLSAATSILRDMVQVECKIGKPFLRDMSFTEDSVVIMIGVTGEMRGQVMIAFARPIACDVAGRMMMNPGLTELDEIGMSAICELGNMIMGNTATIFSTKGIGIDITPPTMCNGNVKFSTQFTKNICIPLTYDTDKVVEFNIAIKAD